VAGPSLAEEDNHRFCHWRILIGDDGHAPTREDGDAERELYVLDEVTIEV
jgi:hypothetical protein